MLSLIISSCREWEFTWQNMKTAVEKLWGTRNENKSKWNNNDDYLEQRKQLQASKLEKRKSGAFSENIADESSPFRSSQLQLPPVQKFEWFESSLFKSSPVQKLEASIVWQSKVRVVQKIASESSPFKSSITQKFCHL